MLDWVNAHGLAVGLGFLIYSSIVSTMPTAEEVKGVRPNIDPLTLLLYSKLYQLLHLLAGNLARIVPQLRMLNKPNGEKL